MIDSESRYYQLETRTTIEDGREVAYKSRRFLPKAQDHKTLTQVSVAQGDRLDRISTKTLGSPLQYWRICDANNSMNPADLTESIGRRLVIPIPEL